MIVEENEVALGIIEAGRRTHRPQWLPASPGGWQRPVQPPIPTGSGHSKPGSPPLSLGTRRPSRRPRVLGVVLAATVVVVGPWVVVLVAAATVVSVAEAGAVVVVAEAGGFVRVDGGGASEPGIVTDRLPPWIEDKAVVTVIEVANVDGAMDVVVVGDPAVVTVRAGWLVVACRSTPRATETVSGWPRVTSSTKAPRKNAARV